MMPTAAWSAEGEAAQSSEDVAEVAIGDNTTRYTDIEAAFTAAQEAVSATVKLLQDVTIPKTEDGYSYGIQLKNGSIVLDLNGWTIQTTDTEKPGFIGRYAVFYLENAMLTVRDNAGSGKIQQPNAGQAISVSSGGTLTVESGTIEVMSDEEASTSSYVTTQNCAVFVSSSGKANIQGGKLIGRQGVYIRDKDGTLTITGEPQIQGKASYALQVAGGKVTLSGGTYSSESNECSILNSTGTADKLLNPAYRYEDEVGQKATYNTDETGVVGTAVVTERPMGEVSYIDASGKETTQTGCVSLTMEGFKNQQAEDVAWYAADSNITSESGFTVTGTVNLILCDGVTVQLNNSLFINDSSTLNIFSQHGGTGRLEVVAAGSAAGIGNNSGTADAVSKLNIYGGTVTAKAGGSGAAAIGKGTGADATVNVTVAEGMKCVRTDDQSKSCKWDNTEGISVTITKCEDHKWVYTYENAEQHSKKCSLCGVQGGAEAHSFDTWTSDGETNHTGTCVCGETKTEAHTLELTPNANGKTHSEKCSICDYAVASEVHDFTGRKDYSTEESYIVCKECSARLAASYDNVKYASLQRAIDAAKGSGGTVTLEQKVEEHVAVADGEVTIDLNDQAWGRNLSDNKTNNYVPLTVTGGRVILKNGRLHQKGSSSEARMGVLINGGSLIVARDVSIRGGDDGNLKHSIDLQSGSLTLSEGTALLTGLKVPADKKLADYLPAGTAFVKCTYEDGVKLPAEDSYEYVTEAYTDSATTESMAVVAHTHVIQYNSENGTYQCACGFTCTHGAFADGRCTTCGYACPHEASKVSENNGSYTCTVCDMQMVVKVTKDGGTTYSTDFAAVMNAAEDGTTITLLKDVDNYNQYACITGDGKTVTLALAGHTINGGLIKAGNNRDNNEITSVTLKITGSGSVITAGELGVGAKATLDLSEWGSKESDRIKAVSVYKNKDNVNEEGILIVGEDMQGTIESLGFYSRSSPGIKTKLKGGRYGSITLTMTYRDGEPYSSMLEKGYAFQYIGTEKFVEYTKRSNYSGINTIENVKVVKCPHGGDATETEGSYKCAYCDTAVTAKVSRGGTDAYYATLADALNNAKDKDTVTLMAAATDAESYTITHAITLDLNGFNIGTVTCSAEGVKLQDSGTSKGTIGTLTVPGGQLKNLLPEGYGFQKAGNTWAGESELNGTTINNVCVKQAPIKSLHLTVKKETVTYGYEEADAPTITTEVTFPSESTGTTDVKYQWYQVKESSAEPITDATADTYRLNTGLDADTYTFYCIAAAGGYAAASEDVSVTVEKAEADGTAPQAAESLSYTGSAQELIISGSTSDGDMKYSLAQDGTYTDGIPTGTDAGTYTVWYKIIGDKNHKDSEPARVKVTIAPMKLSGVVRPEADGVNRVYNNTDAAELTAVTFLKENGTDTISLAAGDYTVSNAHFNDGNAGGDKQLIFTVTLKSQNYVFAGEAAEGVTEKTFNCAKDSSNAAYEIAKAAAPANLVNVDITQKYTITQGSASAAGAGMPQDAGTLSYAKQSDGAIGKAAHWEVDAVTGKVTYTLSGGAANDAITLPVTISSTNYNDAAVSIVITLTEKDMPTVTVQDLTVTYDGSPVSAEKIQGTAVFGGKPVAGAWEWKNSPAVTAVADSGEKTVVFKPQEPETYAQVEKTIYLTINKATPAGTPKYDAITANEKQLSDAGLTTEGSTLSVEGTVKWVENDGNELSEETAVVRGEAYRWEFTPTDTDNYNKLTGTIILWAKPSSTGGGVGGGGAAAPANPDADVITVKEDTKDNTASEPTVTTKTTIKDAGTEKTKNEQGQDVSKTTASVSEELGDKLLDQAVANNSHNVEITVKSDTGNSSAADAVKSTELELPKSTVASIAGNTDANLVIKTDNGEVVLDNKTLAVIASEAKGTTVKIAVSENTKLTEAQKPAENIVGGNGRIFDLEVQLGEKLLHNFRGGKAYVTLPMPEQLQGKDIVVIYIDDNGICRILDHSIEAIGADSYIKFVTTHFSTFAVVEKAGAEKFIKEQNQAQVKKFMNAATFKVTTAKTGKKSVKVQITAKSSKTLISDIKSMGYTVRYQFYRSKKKSSGYRLLGTGAANTFTNTKGTKGTRYYYKVRVLVYDDRKLVAKSKIKQCSYGAATWNK